jgi:hypothetical protein
MISNVAPCLVMILSLSPALFGVLEYVHPLREVLELGVAGAVDPQASGFVELLDGLGVELQDLTEVRGLIGRS